ncbi:37 kDa salivary gland allergen Aed a 2-like [Anopheles nili]|uniref:37 kDa salivary gland allergen Aed a 2-like n=1 Tax=Anopheles nili TaxID=185578 RepID=UPI00237B00CA|nr:37 kDa salivary gland allergen Aed a 2-like [Anopheles nili]
MQFVVNPVHLVRSLALLLIPLLIRPSEAGCNHNSAEADDDCTTLSPDDTLFAHLRCFELYASSQPMDRMHDASAWMGCDETYLKQSERAPEFVRCVLGWLRLFDSKTSQFDANIIRSQFNVFERWLSIDEESVERFINDTNAIGLLNSTHDAYVYDAFESLFRIHSKTYFELFLRDSQVLQKMYNQEVVPVRKPNQTVTQFCELHMSPELWTDICLIRAYEISNHTKAMEDHITCIFRGFHYLTEQSSINVHEIARDFNLTGSLNDSASEHIHQCAGKASREPIIPKRCLAMYSCLLEGESSRSFKDAFDFREVRSGNLSFTLQNLAYDRDQVKLQILALDRERCDDQHLPASRLPQD